MNSQPDNQWLGCQNRKEGCFSLIVFCLDGSLVSFLDWLNKRDSLLLCLGRSLDWSCQKDRWLLHRRSNNYCVADKFCRHRRVESSSCTTDPPSSRWWWWWWPTASSLVLTYYILVSRQRLCKILYNTILLDRGCKGEHG